MHIAFVTYKDLPHLSYDDRVLADYLQSHEIIVSPVTWDDESVKWSSFDAIVMRSMWDYFFESVRFREWLRLLSSLNCRVMNPVEVVEWNMDKNYFNDFSRKGIRFPAYHYCRQNSAASLEDILKKRNWERAVVKPAISGGAINTWVTTMASSPVDDGRFNGMLQSGDVIVQEFRDEIVMEGELSLLFFNKRFSHAVCKKARIGDFRVQTQFGGVTVPVQPGKAVLEQAEALLHNIPQPLLYARVDGFMSREGEFFLMELELVEPVLFISSHEDARENFLQAFRELLM